MRNLLIEWARQWVGHKRPVCHGIDVLHQVMEEVTVGAGQQQRIRQKQSVNAADVSLCAHKSFKQGREP